MRILWISNIIFPDACRAMNLPIPVVGGWMQAGAKSLIEYSEHDIELAVAATYNGKDLKELTVNGIKYYLIPKNEEKLNHYFRIIKDDFSPDLTHIHGSEYPHSLSYVNACGNENVVVSIQGLVSVISKYYYGGISKRNLMPTLRDLLRNDSLYLQKKRMYNRGKKEVQLISKINYVIGRTRWDASHVWAINSDSKYYFCNETLRDSFYTETWNIKNCEKHTLFLSQAHYPIKGLQQIIEALPLVKKKYPNVKIYIAGNNFLNVSKLKRNGFAKYIQNRISQLNLENHINFVGMLDEKQMVNQYLKAHVFVCPSSIENSPNSVGEAQLLGVPTIASYVGGSMDMITDGETGFLYRFEEIELLAYRICQLFDDEELCQTLSTQAKEAAEKRHDKKNNAKELYSIYKDILRND